MDDFVDFIFYLVSMHIFSLLLLFFFVALYSAPSLNNPFRLDVNGKFHLRSTTSIGRNKKLTVLVASIEYYCMWNIGNNSVIL